MVPFGFAYHQHIAMHIDRLTKAIPVIFGGSQAYASYDLIHWVVKHYINGAWGNVRRSAATRGQGNDKKATNQTFERSFRCNQLVLLYGPIETLTVYTCAVSRCRMLYR